jgi:hypothetical protein
LTYMAMIHREGYIWMKKMLIVVKRMEWVCLIHDLIMIMIKVKGLDYNLTLE